MVPDGYPVPEQRPVRPSVPQLGGAGRDIGEPSLRVNVAEQGPDIHGAHAPRIEPQGDGGAVRCECEQRGGNAGCCVARNFVRDLSVYF